MIHFYSGDDGVFYNPVNDMVFVLRKCRIPNVNHRTGEVLNERYDFQDMDGAIRDIAIEMSVHTIRIGEL